LEGRRLIVGFNSIPVRVESNLRLSIYNADANSDVTSPNSVLTISVYDRSKAGEGFLGVKEIKPVLKDGVTVDNWFSLSPRGEEHVTGEIWLQISYDALKVRRESGRVVCGRITRSDTSFFLSSDSIEQDPPLTQGL
jgi:hypothetical protein